MIEQDREENLPGDKCRSVGTGTEFGGKDSASENKQDTAYATSPNPRWRSREDSSVRERLSRNQQNESGSNDAHRQGNADCPDRTDEKLKLRVYAELKR